jgi:hypothetical protein
MPCALQPFVVQNLPPDPGHKTESASVGRLAGDISGNRIACTIRPRTLETRHTMATDYDAPRKTDDELAEDSLEELKARRADASSSVIDVDEAEAAESHELPGADLSHEELSVRVLPKQADEFTCTRCFLVHHRSQLVSDRGSDLICRDCAA